MIKEYENRKKLQKDISFLPYNNLIVSLNKNEDFKKSCIIKLLLIITINYLYQRYYKMINIVKIILNETLTIHLKINRLNQSIRN